MADGAYEAVIGLEIHCQLDTATKMFCGCALEFGLAPNTRTCEVCLGLPGALPVTNGEAVERAIRIGVALGSQIAASCRFHRKNYFYPDLPKGYQISQYDEPICVGGVLAIPRPPADGGGELVVRLTRAHLEEDAAKLVHSGGAEGRIEGASSSVVDFNRGGAPLVEIVTEPDVRSAADARLFLQTLRSTLVTLGVSACDMERGQMRFDANVSLRPAGTTELGVKTELKNMNSFSYVERGIDAEIARQTALLDAGERVHQETLHYDPASGAITSLRSKEEAHDYRYFPEPDLVPLTPTREQVARVRAELGETPVARLRRFTSELALPYATAVQLTGLDDPSPLADVFDAALAAGPAPGVGEGRADARAVANLVTGEWARRANAGTLGHLTPGRLREVADRRAGGSLTGETARTVLSDAAETDRPVADLAAEQAPPLSGGDDAELRAVVARLLADHPAEAERLRSGERKLTGFFVGQAKRATGGRADARAVQGLLAELTA